MLSVKNLSKDYGEFAIRDVSFEVEEGEYFVLLGASGVGKTVLLEAIAGLVRPDSGQVFLDGRDITNEKIQKRGLGLVYQDQALFPHMTVRGNIAYGLRHRRFTRDRIREKVNRMAQLVGAEDLLHRYPSTLSGGETQRVALARTLAIHPRCLLLDEPISSLDMQSRSEMRALLRTLHRKGHTLLHVTHDYEEALSLASRVGIMEDGALVQTGEPKELFHNPRSQFVAQFIGIRNFFKGRLEAPGSGNGTTSRFVANGLHLSVLTDGKAGPGHLMLRSEDITVSKSRTDTSALNNFKGLIVDIAPARLGVEVTVDIGVDITALVTQGSVSRMTLECGQDVWISFKATAAQFIED